MIRYTTIKVIHLDDWDELVRETYGKPYKFQQQEGYRERPLFEIKVPVPIIDEGTDKTDSMKEWMDTPVDKDNIYWVREFYPDIDDVVNDLFSRGLLDQGDYSIEMDWFSI